VVRHLEHELTIAMGAQPPGTWWESRDDHRDDAFYLATLPSVADVAAIQAENPQTLAAYIADRDAPPLAGLWHATPVPRPTMSVAGVAITASLAQDGAVIIDIDPTGTPHQVMRPAGDGTPIRVRVADTTMSSPHPAPVATPPGNPDEENPATDGEWQPNTASGDVPIPVAPTPDMPISALKHIEGWFDGDGKMRGPITTADIAHDNGRCAGFAVPALLAYALRTGLLSPCHDEGLETVLGDLLRDLRHFADALGMNYAEIDEHSQDHYEDELRGH
jgi:hypothetical protein